MDKIKEIFNMVVAYCKEEPFHLAILGGLAVFIVIVLMLIIGRAAKCSKAKKAAKKVAKKAAIAAKTEENVKISPVEEPQTAKVEQPTAAEVAITEENSVQPVPAPVVCEKTEPTPAPVVLEKVEPTPAPVVCEKVEPAQAETNEPVEIAKDEPKAETVEIKEEAPAPAPLKMKEETPAREEESTTETVKETEDAPVAEKTAVVEEANEDMHSAKEGTMLHDEFKDVNTELDFYEEDETDIVARYSGKWVIFRVLTEDNGTDEEMYFFELHASNGEKLLSSEEYTTYNGAVRGIETHKTNILKNNFRITLSKKGDYIFKLLNGKGMLLCMGEHYATKARCESAIESAKRFARTAFVDENIQDQIVKVPPEDDASIDPVHENYNGKWVIDSHVSAEGERVFFFELFANNGERLLSSEEYTSYIGAINGIQTHKANIQKGNFRISLTKHGDYIYKLLNGNNQLLCLGEHYKTKRRCQNAVESVKRFAMNSPILTDPELTKI